MQRKRLTGKRGYSITVRSPSFQPIHNVFPLRDTDEADSQSMLPGLLHVLRSCRISEEPGDIHRVQGIEVGRSACFAIPRARGFGVGLVVYDEAGGVDEGRAWARIVGVGDLGAGFDSLAQDEQGICFGGHSGFEASADYHHNGIMEVWRVSNYSNSAT
jgi:hypothetical protein